MYGDNYSIWRSQRYPLTLTFAQHAMFSTYIDQVQYNHFASIYVRFLYQIIMSSSLSSLYICISNLFPLPSPLFHNSNFENKTFFHHEIVQISWIIVQDKHLLDKCLTANYRSAFLSYSHYFLCIIYFKTRIVFLSRYVEGDILIWPFRYILPLNKLKENTLENHI